MKTGYLRSSVSLVILVFFPLNAQSDKPAVSCSRACSEQFTNATTHITWLHTWRRSSLQSLHYAQMPNLTTQIRNTQKFRISDVYGRKYDHCLEQWYPVVVQLYFSRGFGFNDSYMPYSGQCMCIYYQERTSSLFITNWVILTLWVLRYCVCEWFICCLLSKDCHSKAIVEKTK